MYVIRVTSILQRFVLPKESLRKVWRFFCLRVREEAMEKKRMRRSFSKETEISTISVSGDSSWKTSAFPGSLWFGWIGGQGRRQRGHSFVAGTARSGSVFSRVFLAVVLALGFVLAACGDDDDNSDDASTSSREEILGEARTLAQEVVYVDASGEEIIIDDISRIVVLNGDLMEVVFALGFGPNVVARDLSATYPPEAAALPEIGYQRSLSTETVLSYAPTLVLGTTEAGPAEKIKQLRDTGTDVVIIEPENSFAGAAEKIRQVGIVLGVPEEGESLAVTLLAQLEAVRVEAGPDAPRVAFSYMRGANILFILGEGSPAHPMITAAGAIDVGAVAEVGEGEVMTPEMLVTMAPDVFLVTEDGLASVGGIDGMLALPGVAQTPAGANRAIIAFDTQYLLGLGPRSADALADLVTALKEMGL